jgi:hypothetical protein
MRGRIAAALVERPDSFWVSRAELQLQLTAYRLVFREFFYDAPKRALPLPPHPLWNIDLVGSPKRQMYQGHDVVTINYTFDSVLLTDLASPGLSEPKLKTVGGKWREPFVLPLDPEFVMQRTGFACMDESEFPFASVDSEEVDSFYDQTCDVEAGLSNDGQCHYTKQPTQSCVEAVQNNIGKVETTVLYERLPWDSSLADRYRYGEVTGNEPDLQIFAPEFAPSRVTYRYIRPDACEIVEDSVGGTGWRRLLQFATSDENVGNKDLTIGGVDYHITGTPGELDAHRLFEYSACHGHYHFKYYGTLGWSGGGGVVNSKKGFCLQSTARSANREGSPLHNPFGDCIFQGVAAGWIDEYKIGLSGQWIDTTGLPAGRGTRSFRSNPNGFLCEGTFVDRRGRPIPDGQPVVWAPTGLTAEDGHPVEAPLCRLQDDWNQNNKDSTTDTIPPFGQGLITEPCTRGQIGPLRNCGFGAAPAIGTCVPGALTTISLSVPAGSAPQVARLTDFSHQLHAPIPARYEDSWVPLSPGVSDQPATLANVIVLTSPHAVTFTCPSSRGAGTGEPGGKYGIYGAPVFPEDAAAPILAS